MHYLVLVVATLASVCFTGVRAEDAQADREELVKKLKEVLPKGWTAAINPEPITGGDSPDDIAIWREEKTPMRRVAPPNPDPATILQEAPAKLGYMYFKLLSSDKYVSVDEFRLMKKENDERLKAIKTFHAKLQGATLAAMLPVEDIGPQFFKPRTDQHKAIIIEFQSFWDKTPKHKLPNLHFKSLTFYFEDLRQWEFPTADHVNAEADGVVKLIEKVTAKYE